MKGPDYIVDIDGLRPRTAGDAAGSPADAGAATGGMSGATSGATSRATSGGGGRPWIAVTWKCCSVYSRVYRNRAGTCYEGRCPKCGKPVKARIGPGGTSSRFFEAG